jgi:hypothetical protein
VIPDDAPVPEDMSLYRRVHPSEIVWNDNDGCLRPGSGVFKDREMSVHLDDALQDEGREPESVLNGKPQHSLVSLTAGFVKSEEQAVRRTPRPDDASHGDVCGAKSQARRRRFARAAQFVVLREDALNPDELTKMHTATDGGSG